jgi:hypothetical protein
MAPTPRPALQGELDGLCGVYAVVNAIQWVLHTGHAAANASRNVKRLTKCERQALFDKLVTALGEKRPLAKFVTGGISSVELTRLLNIGREWVARHRNAVVLFRRPFYRKQGPTRPRVVTLLTEHLAAPGSAVIVAVAPPLAHWTVITGVSKKRIRLHDSGYRVFLAANAIDYRGPRPPNGGKPGDIFLLHLSPKAVVRARRP